MSVEIIGKQSKKNRKELYLNQTEDHSQTQMQEALKLCSTRVQNGGLKGRSAKLHKLFDKNSN